MRSKKMCSAKLDPPPKRIRKVHYAFIVDVNVHEYGINVVIVVVFSRKETKKMRRSQGENCMAKKKPKVEMGKEQAKEGRKR